MKENSNWVTARAACSISRVFGDLRAAVKADVDERNRVREGGEDKFGFDSSNGEFSVLRETAASVSTVKFSHDGPAILVSGDGVSLRATLALNREGACRFHLDGEELEGWQFRMKALDALFFEA